MSKSKEAIRTHKLLTKIIPVESCTDKDIRLVKPSECKMWERHNRVYADLTEVRCRSLIASMLTQGKQELAAIVRLSDDPNYEFEVICGARRHWSVTYLRENGYPEFLFQIDVRNINDEESFMLGHVENSERKDINNYERALDFLDALNYYYKSQKSMALTLGVKEEWLSRYLDLARLPKEVVNAFPANDKILPGHAKILKPLLQNQTTRKEVIDRALELKNSGSNMSAADVVKALTADKNLLSECVLTSVSRKGRQVFVNVRPKKLIIHMPIDGVCKNKVEAASYINDYFGEKIVN